MKQKADRSDLDSLVPPTIDTPGMSVTFIIGTFGFQKQMQTYTVARVGVQLLRNKFNVRTNPANSGDVVVTSHCGHLAT